MTSPAHPKSVFEKFAASKAWPWHYDVTLQIGQLIGGTPRDPNVAMAWLQTKLGKRDDLIRDMVADIMATNPKLTLDEATKEANELRHLNGFRRDEVTGQLFMEGRHLKAAIKEAVSVAASADKIAARGWGKTNKGIHGFVAEHIQVMNDRLPIFQLDSEGNEVACKEPTLVEQRFISTFRGSGIQYEESVHDAIVHATIWTDYAFTDNDWAMLWSTGELQGFGASRSQSYGRYAVTEWKLTQQPPKQKASAEEA